MKEEKESRLVGTVESHILKACLDLLESLRRAGKPIIATRTNSGKVQTIRGQWIKLCDAGTGDIMACIAGVPVMIETKCGRNGQEDTQIATQRKWELAGGVYLLVNKISDLRDYLRGEGLLP